MTTTAPQLSCELDSSLFQGACYTTLCEKYVSGLQQVGCSLGTLASSTNKADHYDVSGLQQVGSSLGTLVSSTNKIYHYDINEK